MSLTIIFIYLNFNAFAGDVDIESHLLKRKEITKFDLKNKILKNKSVNFEKLITLRVDYNNSEINYYELPEDDPLRRNPDITLAQKQLMWKPIVELEYGLKKTIDYFRRLNETT